MALWIGNPQAGTSWRGHPEAIDGRKLTETYHVADRTFGGGVVYVRGRRTRFALQHTVSLDEWNAWVNRTGARKIAR